MYGTMVSYSGSGQTMIPSSELKLWELYCAFHKHANSKIQKPLPQLHFLLPSTVFSLNFSSAGKGPFRDCKAKNTYFSKRGGGGGEGTVE